MSWQNLRHNPLPSIWERPHPSRRLSREERVQTRARVLRARVQAHYHPRRLRVLARLQPFFRQADKRAKARSRVLRQVRAQQQKLPLGLWQAAIGHALNETEHPEDGKQCRPRQLISVPTVVEEDSSEEDIDFDPDAKSTRSSSGEENSDSDKVLEDKETSDAMELKKERRTRKKEKRLERRLRREAARDRRLERRVLRFASGDTDEEEAQLVREHEATRVALEQKALSDLRKLKKPRAKPAKRIKPNLLMRRIRPELVDSVELPSEDRADEDYDPGASIGNEGEALRARIGEKAEEESEVASEQALGSASSSEAGGDEAMDEDEVEAEGAVLDVSLETAQSGATADSGPSMQSADV